MSDCTPIPDWTLDKISRLSDVEFKCLIYVYRNGPGIGGPGKEFHPSLVAKAIGEDKWDVSAAMSHLADLGHLRELKSYSFGGE